MNTQAFKNLEFELAYLALLTHEGLKPLSRWEKDFDRATEQALQGLGLKTRIVERSVRSGRRLRELIFSRSDPCLELYASRFNGAAIERSPATMRFEGRLFGYPTCCIESFVAHGYTRNGLRRRDQRILFHWACPQCGITPLLLPHYRRVYRHCRGLRRGRGAVAGWLSEPWVPGQLTRALALAASLAALAVLPGLGKDPSDKPDPHWLPLVPAEDPDRDYLASAEEVILGFDPANPDQNANGQPDGPDLALRLSGLIDALPTTPSATQPYVVHHMAFGLENCQVCGAVTNMGALEIVNPLENQSFAMPYVAKHFLEHGSFSYNGTIHSGRLNPPQLNTVLSSVGLAHFIPEPPGTDADTDGLRQWEEPALGTDPANPDTDGDRLIDGVDVMRAMRAQLDALPRTPQPDRPYLIEHPMDGIETCPRCGERVVMGIWEVINPVTRESVPIPSMALHYMQHGGPSWEGGRLFGGKGRVDPRQLQAVLTGQRNPHLLPVTPDSDRDWLADPEELDLGADPADPDQNGNGVPDGLDRAREAVAEIAALPTQPSTNRVYRVDVPLRGLEQCDACGTNVNMGHLIVCNPMAQLYVQVPYIALHYLECDSFSFAGDVHGKGRIDVKLLLEALRSTGPSHLLPVQPDTDGDWLSDHEERAIGTDPLHPDQDQNRVPDGADLARKTVAEIAALPTQPSTNRVYRVDVPLRGLERCDVCGTTVNMGHLVVCNPMAQLYVQVPYIALHYLRCSSFSFAGDVHGKGRIDVELLLKALHSTGPSHMLPVSGDSDGDGLKDSEEARFGTHLAIPDSDGDGVPDGFGLASQMASEVKALPGTPRDGPYAEHHPLLGVVPCPVCGRTVNMGWVDVINPKERLSLAIPYLALHFMQHGSFAWSRTGAPPERVNPCLLDVILHGDGTSHLVIWAGDTDRDGLLDGEEAHFGTRPEAPDTDGDGILDGIEVARTLHQRVEALPVGPHPSGRYRLLFEADCYRPCPVCGEDVNCGHLLIVNNRVQRSVRVTFLNLHYLEHGSLAASVTERIDPVQLDTLLQAAVTITAGTDGVTLRWIGQPGRTYQIFTAEHVTGPWTPGPTFQGDGSELVFTEPASGDRPQKFYQVRMW